MNKATIQTEASDTIVVVHPKPEEAYKMPYAPAVKIVGCVHRKPYPY